jgi:hypothetical protein
MNLPNKPKAVEAPKDEIQEVLPVETLPVVPEVAPEAPTLASVPEQKKFEGVDLNPSNWEITNTKPGHIRAHNLVSKAVFEGETKAFCALLKG